MRAADTLTTAAAVPVTLPTLRDVEAAARRIKSLCIETPLLESPHLNRQLGGRLLLKAENLQVTGSFKLRGAANRVAALTDDERRRGVVARSSGNHGLAIAYCAGLMGTSAIVVVPDTAPAAKVARIAAHGARVVQVPMRDLAAVASELTARENRVLVPPADDFWVVAGAATVALEIAAQAAWLHAKVDAVLACCSGGGLTAGCLLGLSAASPATKVHAVEAVGFEKMAKSLAAGRRIDLQPGGHSICDAICGLYMAEIPFEIIRPRVADTFGGTFAVTDDDAKAAMRVAFSEFGLAVEPGGAVALAAVLVRKMPLDGKTVVVTLSGRNVDLDLMARVLGEGEAGHRINQQKGAAA
jgi:threonine dehydratase